MNQNLKKYLKKIKLPASNSHKGQNGKLLIIGGSELFHAASKWSLDVASKFVDMVFYSSVPENNELIKEAKGEFWNGIIVPRGEVESYVQEADCVLIGPGMARDEATKRFVDRLVGKFGLEDNYNPVLALTKKWVIDAGALQVIDPKLLSSNHIITPHKHEMESLREKFENAGLDIEKLEATILLKGVVDEVSFVEGCDEDYGDKFSIENASSDEKTNLIKKSDGATLPTDNKRTKIKINGGNAGMTKGGSGDSLAGLVAALYCNHDPVTAAVVGSYINKKAGDELYKKVGPYFNTSDLVRVVPEIFWKVFQAK